MDVGLCMALICIQRPAEEDLRSAKTRVQLDGFFESAESASEISIVRQDRAERSVRIGEGGIELKRPFCRGQCCLRGLSRRGHPADCTESLTVGERSPRQRGGRVELQRTPCVTKRDFHRLRRSGGKRVET